MHDELFMLFLIVQQFGCFLIDDENGFAVHLNDASWHLGRHRSFDRLFVYAMRRVSCPSCGVKVETVPWASDKHQLTDT